MILVILLLPNLLLKVGEHLTVLARLLRFHPLSLRSPKPQQMQFCRCIALPTIVAVWRDQWVWVQVWCNNPLIWVWVWTLLWWEWDMVNHHKIRSNLRSNMEISLFNRGIMHRNNRNSNMACIQVCTQHRDTQECNNNLLGNLVLVNSNHQWILLTLVQWWMACLCKTVKWWECRKTMSISSHHTDILVMSIHNSHSLLLTNMGSKLHSNKINQILSNMLSHNFHGQLINVLIGTNRIFLGCLRW